MSNETTYIAIDESFDLSLFTSLGLEHFSEVEKKSQSFLFELDLDILKLLLDNNQLVVVVALQDEVLVGYYASVISKDLFTKEEIAKEVAIYVREDLRSSGICTELFRLVEKELISLGISVNYTGFKKDHNEEFPIKLGYEVSEIIYQKVLK